MVDTKTITRLALEHIQRFENLLRAAEKGNRNVRVGECLDYLNIWTSIKEKKGEWKDLTRAERIEIACAQDDEQQE